MRNNIKHLILSLTIAGTATALTAVNGYSQDAAGNPVTGDNSLGRVGEAINRAGQAGQRASDGLRQAAGAVDQVAR